MILEEEEESLNCVPCNHLHFGGFECTNCEKGAYCDYKGMPVLETSCVEPKAATRRPINTSEQELNTVGKEEINAEWEKVTMTADTGAVNHVVTTATVPHLKLKETAASKSGASFTGAEGSKLPNLGEKDIHGFTNEGLAVDMTWQVAGKLRKNLAAISKVCDQGNRAVFDNDGSYIENKVTKAIIPMKRVGGLFEFDIWISRPKGEAIKTGKDEVAQTNTFAILNSDGQADIIDDFDTESGFTRLVDRM